MRFLCYAAAVPLLVYAALLTSGVIDRTDASVAVLLFAEGAAVVLTIYGTLERYRGRGTSEPPDRRTPVDRRAPVDPAEAVYPRVDRRGAGPNLYDEEHHPRQRKRDHGWRYWIGWLYRHLVPAIAIAVAAWAVGTAGDASSQAERNAKAASDLSAANRRALVAIQDGRRAAIRESCEQDEAIADVLRRALLGFGVGRDRPAPPGVREAFQPLGGLRPLSEERKRERCDRRVARGGP